MEHLLAPSALAVTDPETLQPASRVKIWGRKKAIRDENQGEYALNVTQPILNYFAGYYGVKYPLPKSDQVALPDFGAGAMENWGLVTYRETALLYDPLESSIGNKERVVTVIAHELAHQWFGNLVTIRWWNDLWLNEGFASYVEYLGANKAEETWNIIDLAVLYDVHNVMGVDALASSHPLTSNENEVNSPSEISALFDSITYSKGASVIRMLSSFLTEGLFVKGLQDGNQGKHRVTKRGPALRNPMFTLVTGIVGRWRAVCVTALQRPNSDAAAIRIVVGIAAASLSVTAYLKEFEYDNTVYVNLWNSLQAAYDSETVKVDLPANIETIMNTWVLQMGFPVVTINTATGTLTQKHFLLDPNSTVTRPSEFNEDIAESASHTPIQRCLREIQRRNKVLDFLLRPTMSQQDPDRCCLSTERYR
ncbi:unnamed protein product [Ranitomeya imitator]|uniref:Peptidase M1 membrane alanine aminopeptidase domain-containing protein n=1 Tax=Ranitomeya imitator TaxID=111125 RepID=A0ABN9LW28_9NEOB|nr:unnamed protein product [Ranitomeya imitator]